MMGRLATAAFLPQAKISQTTIILLDKAPKLTLPFRDFHVAMNIDEMPFIEFDFVFGHIAGALIRCLLQNQNHCPDPSR
jgi:hypothetical protein